MEHRSLKDVGRDLSLNRGASGACLACPHKPDVTFARGRKRAPCHVHTDSVHLESAVGRPLSAPRNQHNRLFLAVLFIKIQKGGQTE